MRLLASYRFAPWFSGSLNAGYAMSLTQANSEMDRSLIMTGDTGPVATLSFRLDVTRWLNLESKTTGKMPVTVDQGMYEATPQLFQDSELWLRFIPSLGIYAAHTLAMTREMTQHQYSAGAQFTF
jgi:hypothetical protein